MAANKVIVNNQTILDLTADTVTAATLKKGVTAHDASGAQITGTMEEASTSETWVLNNIISTLSAFSFSVSFTSNGASYTGLKTSSRPSLSGYDLWYTNSSGSYDAIYNAEIHYWTDAAYRKLVFDEAPTGDLLTWLTDNGVKQPANLAVQPSKDVTITSNGTTEITPDAPYDVMEKANVTVDVASGGGVETCTLKVASADLPMWSYFAFATGIDGVFEITGFGTYNVVKNSMFFLYGGVRSTTNLTEMYNNDGNRVYKVTGDAQIKVS